MPLLRKLASTTPLGVDLGLLLLRLWFGLMLAFGHGLSKMTGLTAFSENVAAQGFPAADLMAFAAAASELIGGLLLATGLLTRAAAIPVAATMMTAAFWIHADDPFLFKKEFALCYAAAALVLLLAGPGRASLDHRLFGDRMSPDR